MGYGEDTVFDNFALRDTEVHFSSASDNRGAIPKTIIVHNTTDKDVVVQLRGDRTFDFSTPMDVGEPFIISAGTNDYATIDDYLPFLRIAIHSDTAPTSGTISVFLMRVKN
jgi:hypothetical protein